MSNNYHGLGWYVHLNKENYFEKGINPNYLNKSVSVEQAVKQQETIFNQYIDYVKADNIISEELKSLEDILNMNINNPKNFDTMMTNSIFKTVLEEELGGDTINQDLTIVQTRARLTEKLNVLNQISSKLFITETMLNKILTDIDTCIKHLRANLTIPSVRSNLLKLQRLRKDLNREIAHAKATNVAGKYAKYSFGGRNTAALDLTINNNKDLINNIYNIIFEYRKMSEAAQLGAAAEVVAAYTLLAADKTANSVSEKELRKSLQGTNQQTSSMQLGSEFSRMSFDKKKSLAEELAEKINWNFNSSSGTISHSSPGTIDVLIDSRSQLAAATQNPAHTHALRISVKNYSKNAISIVSPSLFSMLSVFTNSFANHFLNQLALQAQNPFLLKVAEQGFLLRGLAGYRGRGTSLNSLANILIVNTPGKGFKAYSIGFLLSNIEKALSCLNINPSLDTIHLNNQAVDLDKGRNYLNAAQRIINLLKNAQALKLKVTFNAANYTKL